MMGMASIPFSVSAQRTSIGESLFSTILIDPAVSSCFRRVASTLGVIPGIDSGRRLNRSFFVDPNVPENEHGPLFPEYTESGLDWALGKPQFQINQFRVVVCDTFCNYPFTHLPVYQPNSVPIKVRSTEVKQADMKKFIQFTILALIIIPAFMVAAKSDSGSTAKPSIVLVHGAWADGSGWSGVIDLLQDQGYTVYAPPNPLRGLASDSAYLVSFLQSITGPIILVGHSYGGAVITNAATGNSNVKALVYVDAFVPDQGESAIQQGQAAT